MGGEHTEGERETLPERGSAIKGNSVGGAFALPTAGGTADGSGALSRHGEMKRQAGIAREVVVVVVAMSWGIWVSWDDYLCPGEPLKSF